MNNYIFTSSFFKGSISIWFFLLLCYEKANAQFCSTIGANGSIGPISYSGKFSPPSLPVYLKIYVHSVGQNDGTGAPTSAQIEESIRIMQAAFAPLGIYFVRDCGIIPINSSTLYNTGYVCGLEQYSSHPNGIDIFIGGDNAPSFAAATNIPSKAFLIKGYNTYFGSNQVLARTNVIAHEMGHCLGLWHTFHGHEGGVNCDNNPIDPNECDELVNGSNSSTCGDYVTDTPADPGYVSGCNYTWLNVDANGDLYHPDVNLIMSYAQPICLLYHSSRQGERMQEIIASSSVLQACIVQPDIVSPVIHTNTTWTTSNTPNNGNFLIEGDLVIESGATLTINSGVKVHFEQQNSLIIKPNGRLILHGTLTGAGCSDLTWQGVQVWGGSATQSQYPVGGVYAQGRFMGLPGSLIENAKTAVQLYGPTPSSAGGQISCNQTTFNNNINGVVFANYLNFWPFQGSQQGKPRNYAGSFYRCTFTTDDQYLHTEPFFSFLKMTGVNGVSITGSSFSNNRTIDGNDKVNWGYGIYATDAGFSITGAGNGSTYPPASYTNSAFNGLGYGIYASKAYKNRPYSVQLCDFNKCYTGIHNLSVTGGTILFNNFNIGQVAKVFSDPPPQQTEGIIFDTDIAGFTCEQNNFTQVTGPFGVQPNGIVCKQTGMLNKTVRNNIFTGLTFGNVANGQNGSNSGSIRGLDYECNILYSTTDADFSVPIGWVKIRQGVEGSSPTGTVYYAAGNQFSYSGTDFDNSGGTLTNYYYDPSATKQTPQTTIGITAIAAASVGCPDTYCAPPCHSIEELNGIKNDYYVNQAAYQNVKTHSSTPLTEANLTSLAYYQRIMDADAYTVVVHEMYDTTGYNPDTLNLWVRNLNSIESDLWLSSEWLNDGNATSSIALLNAAPSKYGLTADQQADVTNYKSVINLLTGKSLYSLDATTQQSLQSYTNVGGYTEAWAKSILTLHGRYFPPTYITSSGVHGRSELTKPVSTENWLIVHPNPAKDVVIFTLSLPPSSSAASIRVFDMNGRIVFKHDNVPPSGDFTWDATPATSGVYFYQLVLDGNISRSGKIILNK